jgi:type VII secretion integral membrane protein EccD
MTAAAGTGLARVTVSSAQRRIDVALPDDVPVAELLPEILRHAGESAADDGEQHGGWVLRRATGALVEPARNLAAQGIRDGEVMHLVPGRAEWPELEYDDVVEAIASGARRYGRSWGGAATRRCALAVAAVMLVLSLADIGLASPPWRTPGLVALALAASLTLVGIALARAGGDAVAGAVLAASGLPHAFLGGGLLTAPEHASITGLGVPQVLVGSVALLLFGVLGYVGVGALSRLFAAAITAGLLGVVAGLLGLTSLSSAGVTAIVVTIAIGLMPGYPLLSIRLGRLPLPALPQRAEDMLVDQPLPQRSDVYAAVARSDEILTGILFGVSAVALVSSALLIGSDDRAARVLAVVASLALLMRARLFPTPRQRLPLIVAGLGGVVVLALVVAWEAHTNAQLYVLVVVTAALGALTLAAGLLYSRRPPSPYLGRMADYLDVLLIVALVPITCIVVGFYSYMQDLFASVGS